ncbi:MAG: hypothetical protein ABSB35_17465 [Bryobacteraceae bacterium]
MRCLYCGKELALLKRLTGGGEFCSDAHRHQYQEEYNQLALNRLLQAKPREKQAAEGKTADAKTSESKHPESQAPPSLIPPNLAPPNLTTPPIAAPEQIIVEARREEPAYSSPAQPEPVAAAPEEPAPAELADFLVELPLANEPPPPTALKAETEPEIHVTPSLPSREAEIAGTLLGNGQIVVLPVSVGPSDHSLAPSERGIEPREFPRGTLVLDPRLSADAGPELGSSEQPVDFFIAPQAPRPAEFIWQEPAREFGRIELELGDLARVSLPTTGLQDDPSGNGKAADQSQSDHGLAPRVEAKRPERRKLDAVRLDPVYVAPALASPERSGSGKTSVAEVVEAEPEKPKAKSFVASSRTTVKLGVTMPQPGRRPEPVPDLITKPMPLSLHGVAAGRAKPVQVFAREGSGGIDVHVPRSKGLPLRPLITFGPATEAKTDPAKADPAKADPVKADQPKVETKAPDRSAGTNPKPSPRPDPRTGKSRGRDVRISEPSRREPVAPAPAATVSAPKVVKEAAPSPAVVESKPAAPPPSAPVRPEQALPKPVAMPAPLSAPEIPMDLGLPTLSMEKSGGLSKGVMIAIAVAVLAIGGVVYFTMQGGSAGASNTHVIEAGPALASGDWAWINDWANDAAAHRQRQISVLGPSVDLADYRVEFQGQIQNKALGWVFRAKDPKNFYVMKLVLAKAGSYPAITLERFAVINGNEEPHAQVPTTVAVTPDNVYNIRFEAVGNRFTTWLQGQKVDEMTDDRIKSGGVGQYHDQGENASLKNGMTVTPLAVKK